MNKKIKLTMLLIMGFLGALAFNKTDVYASDNSTIIKKWVFTQYSVCMRKKWNNDTITEKRNNTLVADDVFGDNVNLMANVQGLPNYGFGWGNDSEVNCSEIFKGENELSGKGVLDYYNDGEYKNVRWSPTNSDKPNELLTGIGYYFISTMDNNERQFKINNTDGETIATITATTRDNGAIDYRVVNSMQHLLTISISGNGNNRVLTVAKAGGCRHIQGSANFTISFDGNDLNDFSRVLSDLENRGLLLLCSSGTSSIAGQQYVLDSYPINFSGEVIESEEGQYEYAKTPGRDRYQVTSGVIQSMSGMNIRGLNLTDSERYTLYYQYLIGTLPNGLQNRMTCDSSVNPNALTPIRLKDSDGEFKDCFVNYGSLNPESIMVYTQTSTQNGAYPEIAEITMVDVIEWFNNVDPSTLDNTIPLVGEAVNPDADEETDNFCQENADGMGWSLCNLVSSIGNGANSLYEQIVEPFLIIDTPLIQTEGLTWQAWNVMMGFANTLMVIYLLIVIFSQITGIGINNYGIKKTLPKLITAAILVNLSFFICQLAVDVSNILGNSLSKGLSDIASGLDVNLQAVSGIDNNTAGWFNGLLAGAVGGLAGIGVASVATGILFGGGLLAGLIIPVLMLLVTVIVSILFFFILLGVRKAAVVIFVIISPLAFVCYMLPNTKTYFDKWYKIFQGLLLVYPICGLLIGGGYLTSKILLNASQDYLMYFTGCIITVVPFFFVPKILKGSFAALGNLGTMMSNMGKSIGGWGKRTLDNTIKQNPSYQARVDYNKDMAAYRSAKRTVGKYSGSDKNLTARQRRALTVAQRRVSDYENRQEKGYSDVYERFDKEQMKNEFATAINGNDAERAVAAFDGLIAKKGAKESFGIMGNVDMWSMDKRMRERMLQKMRASTMPIYNGYAKYIDKGGKGTFAQWANGTASDASSNVAGSMGKYFKDFGNPEKAFSTFSKDEMEFVNDHSKAVSSVMGKDVYGRAMGSVLTDSTNEQAKIKAREQIKDGLASGAMEFSDLGLTAEGACKLSVQDSAAIYDGMKNGTLSGKVSNEQIQAARALVNDIRSDSKYSGNIDKTVLQKLNEI